MSRLLLMMMIVILVIAHGTSVAAAICRHDSGAQHVAALRSDDAGLSAVATGEEDAAKKGSAKGSLADGGSVSWPSDMLPPLGLNVPFRAAGPIERGSAEAAILAGASIPPLLEPPAA
jgi:hypothetical protein